MIYLSAPTHASPHPHGGRHHPTAVEIAVRNTLHEWYLRGRVSYLVIFFSLFSHLAPPTIVVLHLF